MSTPRRITLSAAIFGKIAAIAHADGSSSATVIRDAIDSQADMRRTPLQAAAECSTRVRIPDDLFARAAACADRAGLPLERWFRLAVEAEMGVVEL